MANKGYETVCTNCHETLESDEMLKVGQMVKCSECGTYMLILAIQTKDGSATNVIVMARRVSTYEAKQMGYP